MPRTDAIRLEGRVVVMLSERTAWVELANGHRVLAFGTRRQRPALAGLAPGDTVVLEMTPYDMSKGRIVERRPQP